MPVRDCRHRTRSVAHDLVATLELRGGWFPSRREPRVEQFVMRRSVVPHGDRRDGAESCRVEDQKPFSGPLNNYVVGVLVLSQDLGDVARRRLSPKPIEYVPKRELCAELVAKPIQFSRSRFRGSSDWNVSHREGCLL